MRTLFTIIAILLTTILYSQSSVVSIKTFHVDFGEIQLQFLTETEEDQKIAEKAIKLILNNSFTGNEEDKAFSLHRLLHAYMEEVPYDIRLIDFDIWFNSSIDPYNLSKSFFDLPTNEEKRKVRKI